MSRVVPLLRLLAGPLILVLASFAFVSASVAQHNKISPIDEYVYIDYFAKVIDTGTLPHGEKTSEFARNYLACHGVAPAYTYVPESCDRSAHQDDADYPYNGINTADIYTPLYFGVTRVLAGVVQGVSGVDLVSAGRMAGAFWLAGAAILLFAGLRRFGFDRVYSTAIPLLLVGSLPAWWSNTYISTDATALFFGAALSLVLLRFLQTERGGWMLPVVGLLAVAFKFQNLMSVVAIAMALILIWLIGRFRSSAPSAPKLSLVWAASMVVLPLILQVGWQMLRPVLDNAEDGDQGVAAPLGKTELVHEALKFFGSLFSGATGAHGFGIAAVAVSTVTGWILIGGMVGATAGLRPPVGSHAVAEVAPGGVSVAQRIQPMAIALAFTAIVGGPALAIATKASAGFYFDLPARYGMSLLPIALLVTAGFLGQNRVWRILLSVGAVIVYALSFTFNYAGS